MCTTVAVTMPLRAHWQFAKADLPFVVFGADDDDDADATPVAEDGKASVTRQKRKRLDEIDNEDVARSSRAREQLSLQLNRLPLLVAVEILRSLDYTSFKALCSTSAVFRWRFCGGNFPAGAAERREIDEQQLKPTTAALEMLLQRDYGLSGNTDETSLASPLLAEIAARAFRRHFPLAKKVDGKPLNENSGMARKLHKTYEQFERGPGQTSRDIFRLTRDADAKVVPGGIVIFTLTTSQAEWVPGGQMARVDVPVALPLLSCYVFEYATPRKTIRLKPADAHPAVPLFYKFVTRIYEPNIALFAHVAGPTFLVDLPTATGVHVTTTSGVRLTRDPFSERYTWFAAKSYEPARVAAGSFLFTGKPRAEEQIARYEELKQSISGAMRARIGDETNNFDGDDIRDAVFRRVGGLDLVAEGQRSAVNYTTYPRPTGAAGGSNATVPIAVVHVRARRVAPAGSRQADLVYAVYLTGESIAARQSPVGFVELPRPAVRIDAIEPFVDTSSQLTWDAVYADYDYVAQVVGGSWHIRARPRPADLAAEPATLLIRPWHPVPSSSSSDRLYQRRSDSGVVRIDWPGSAFGAVLWIVERSGEREQTRATLHMNVVRGRGSELVVAERISVPLLNDEAAYVLWDEETRSAPDYGADAEFRLRHVQAARNAFALVFTGRAYHIDLVDRLVRIYRGPRFNDDIDQKVFMPRLDAGNHLRGKLLSELVI